MKRLFRALFLVFLFSLALTQGVNPGLAATVVNYGTEADDSQVNTGSGNDTIT
jgi:hypothetical protein